VIATDSACYTVSWVNDPNNSTLWLGGPGHNGTTCRFD
jgi:hypothetical protein